MSGGIVFGKFSHRSHRALNHQTPYVFLHAMPPASGTQPKGKTNRPAGMDRRIQCLAQAVAEDTAHKPHCRRHVAYSVAVGNEDPCAIEFDLHASPGRIKHSQADLAAEIVEQPYIVVANHPEDLHTAVGKFGQHPKEAHEAAWHHRAILIPVVKNVAKEIQGTGILPDRPQKSNHHRFAGLAVGHCSRSQMQITYKISFVSHF